MSALAAARPSTVPGPRASDISPARNQITQRRLLAVSGAPRTAMRGAPAKGCKEVDVGIAAYRSQEIKTTCASVKVDYRAPARQLWQLDSAFMSGSRDADHGRTKPHKEQDLETRVLATARCVVVVRAKISHALSESENRGGGRKPKTTRVVPRRRLQLRVHTSSQS